MKLLILLFSLNIYATFFSFPIEDESSFEYGNPFEVCENEYYNHHPLKEKQVDFKQYLLYPSCRPEVLYFWAGDKRVKGLKKIFERDNLPSLFKKPIFTSMWPVKTFYYGQNSLRIKLKKNILFKNNFHDGCNLKSVNERKRKQLERTVYYSIRNVKQLGMTYEFLICSPKVIESISFARPEHLQEIYKDLKWSTDKSLRKYGKDYSYIQGPRGYKAIVYNLRNYPFVRSPYLRQSQTPQVIDKLNVNQSTLLRHINYLSDKMDRGLGWIHFNKEIENGRPHFQFEREIYFQSY